MKRAILLSLGALAALVTALSCTPMRSHTSSPTDESRVSNVPTTAATEPGQTVVLVHGAFAEASSWERVIPLLEARGFRAVAVHQPLTSLNADVDAVTRVIDAQTTSVILVGHSWGGTVITEAGSHDKVKALVYFAAFTPGEGETTNDLTKGSPPQPWAGAVKASGGFLSLSRDAMGTYFAQDLPTPVTSIMAATQGPIAAKSFDQAVTHAAWRTKPSTYLVTTEDRMVTPELQRRMARKIGARVTEIPTSHVGMLSRPDDVANVIVSAARQTQ